jgi:hypothetical protein
VAVLMVVILAGCGSGAPATPPVPTEPASPVATAGPSEAAPSQAAPSQAAPGSPEGDVVITAITYSEDPASPFFAVVELGPNDAGISRLDVYRGAEGRLSSIVAYGPEGLPAIISFDPAGRPVRMDTSGYVVEFTYPASDVEVVITAPDGSVVRQRGPLDLGAAVPAPAAPNARLASYMQEPPVPGMVQWPIDVYSYSLVHLAVLRRGINAGSIAEHVTFPEVRCTPAPFMNCAAEIVWAKDWGARETTPRLRVSSWVSAGENPNVGPDNLIWRTRADCDAYKPLVDTALSATGGLIFVGGGIYKVVLAAAANPWITTSLFVVAGAIKAWQWLGPSSKPDCLKVPNLEQAQDALLNRWALATATITVTASGDCDAKSPETGWRIKQPTTQTVTFAPFNPVNRSQFGASAATAETPLVGRIEFLAADCAVDMEGTFDLAAMAAAADMPPGDADDWAKMITKNQVLLELKPGVEPTSSIDATGTFALTYRVSGRGYVTGYDDCVVTSTVTGTLEGKMTQAGRYGGFATIKMVPSLRDCPADFFALKTVILKNVVWTASVKDEITLNGKIVFTTDLVVVDGPPVSWIFIVKAKP